MLKFIFDDAVVISKRPAKNGQRVYVEIIAGEGEEEERYRAACDPSLASKMPTKRPLRMEGNMTGRLWGGNQQLLTITDLKVSGAAGKSSS